MTLILSQKNLAEKIFSDFCDRRVPVEIRDRIYLAYVIEDHVITLFENQVHWSDPGKWSRTDIAQFRFNEKDFSWKLYCRDNDEWIVYSNTEPDRKLINLLAEVEADPARVFWG